MLHQLPPPDTTLRRRRGYQQLDSEENTADGAPSGHTNDDDGDDGHDTAEREVVQHEGWYALGWSFLSASLVTVRDVSCSINMLLKGTLKLSAYFFPIIFAIPLFGPYLAKEWLWYFTPSLSYIGQGIIMGFPTTLSMNLVHIPHT